MMTSYATRQRPRSPESPRATLTQFSLFCSFLRMHKDSKSPDTEREFSARAQQDLVLIGEALAGSAKAYEKILSNYYKSLYHLILKMVVNADDAEDLTSEVFAKAFRYLPRYRPEFAFSTWLFRIATNHTIDFVRRKKLQTQSLNATIGHGDEQGMVWEVADEANPNPQDAFINQQRIDLVRQLVTRLPPKYADLVRLRYFEELSYEEIAVERQAPLGTVKAQLFRARELLLALLKDGRQMH